MLTYPWTDNPAAGTLIPVAPGVSWLRMPLPFALDHINLWVVEDGDGVALIDTGVATPDTRILWESIFTGPLAGRSVTRVFSTHFHPDHMGLAGWLCDRFRCELWATLGEWTFGVMLSLDQTPDFTERQVDFYRPLGFTPEQLEKVRARRNPYAPRVAPLPRRINRLTDGQTLWIGDNLWQVIVGRGHSPEHACLYCPALDVLISGDQVLPRISPNISVWPQEPEADPLALFTESLRVLRHQVPDSALVLPSHGRPFHGLHARIDDLLAHHADRLHVCEEACADRPHTAMELVPVMFTRALDDHQTYFAIGEVLAHLHFLIGQDRIDRLTGDDGTYRYYAVR